MTALPHQQTVRLAVADKVQDRGLGFAEKAAQLGDAERAGIGDGFDPFAVHGLLNLGDLGGRVDDAIRVIRRGDDHAQRQRYAEAAGRAHVAVERRHAYDRDQLAGGKRLVAARVVETFPGQRGDRRRLEVQPQPQPGDALLFGVGARGDPEVADIVAKQAAEKTAARVADGAHVGDAHRTVQRGMGGLPPRVGNGFAKFAIGNGVAIARGDGVGGVIALDRHVEIGQNTLGHSCLTKLTQVGAARTMKAAIDQDGESRRPLWRIGAALP